MLQENRSLRQNISQLLVEKSRVEESIKQSFHGKSFRRDPSNMTSISVFNSKSLIANPNAVDLLKVLNEKELQIDKLRNNCDKLQRTFDELYSPNDLEAFLRNDIKEQSMRNSSRLQLGNNAERASKGSFYSVRKGQSIDLQRDGGYFESHRLRERRNFV